MYTPFRLKPRIFPAVVSATVAASEAITRLRPPSPVADFVVEAGSGMDLDNAGDRKMIEPARPARKLAMQPRKERRSLKAGIDSRFGCCFNVVPGSHLRLPNGASSIRLSGPKAARPTCFTFSITETVCLSIKILDKPH